MSLSNYGDVHLFHRKMGLPHPKVPQLLDTKLAQERINFMLEELEEFSIAYRNDDLPKAFDALLDLAYVVMGTGVMMGLPWQAGWDAVQYANIRKERDTSQDTEHHKGVIKPPGWTPPDLQAVLDRYTSLALKVGGDPINCQPEKVADLAILASERCMICGQRYDQHGGSDKHTFR